MKKHLIIFIVVIIYIISASCHESIVEPKIDPFQYPLAEGNNWTYSGKIYHTDFDPPELGHILDDTIYQTSSVEIESLQVILDSVEAFRVLEHFNSSVAPDSVISLSYYKNEDDGLYYYGTSGYNYCSPKEAVSTNLLNFALGITSFPIFLNNYKPEPFDFINPPLKALDYSFELNSEWTYKDLENPATNPFNIVKKLHSYQRVKVPAGIFDCITVQWIYTDHPEIEFFDYYSSRGLIKRKYIVKDLLYAGYNFPEDTGRATMVTEYDLTDYNVATTK